MVLEQTISIQQKSQKYGKIQEKYNKNLLNSVSETIRTSDSKHALGLSHS